ncbi:Stf0 family sulfotransferase [Mesorhizobium erdmanii]|uniref:Stf0 sulfotransferase n=1 Tax=Mesorhizobium erdmanii TaxID=1777866 RepID=A0A6M7UBY5_9HYPH|nr:MULTISPECIES: Stf0 family sulfotransferase [Mesorhizobium]OBQ69724.1 Stf0 sulfotransferase [Mesorhizobium loti]QKC75309.1 Stf0 sulfotransferase [Mesorhizobium erdmanii]
MFDAYIICGTPRTGSTLLCKLLASTGTSGDPHSFYRRQDLSEWAEEWKLPDRDTMGELEFDTAYLDAAITAGKGGTGVFGLRLMRENLDELSAILDRIFPGLASDAARFTKAFGRILYIHLSRENKLAQAVSLIKAQQTGLWHVAPDGTEIERVAPPQEPQYDFERIKGELAALEAYDAAWNIWFAAQGLTPLRIGYERLSANPAAALLGICEALGVRSPNAEDIRPGVAKLADETSLDWMRRYRLDAARLTQ